MTALIDCRTCARNCCGEIPDLTPVLLDHEVGLFPPETRTTIEVEGYALSLLARKPDGSCVFWQERRCSIYARRPLECRLYPYLLDFSTGTADITLDRRFCGNLHTIAPRERFAALVAGLHPDPRWIRAFETIDGC